MLMNEQRWQALMSSLNLGANTETYHKLIRAYSEKHRFYHNRLHVHACLKLLDQVQSLGQEPRLIELALWFHDAIYKIFSSNNEENSANWAADFLKLNGADASTTDKVRALIMATQHDTAPGDNDAKLLVDIDLSILASPQAEYREFETNIRREYSKVPGLLYRQKRRQILESFVQRQQIYNHAYCQKNFEKQARVNLNAAIQDLSV